MTRTDCIDGPLDETLPAWRPITVRDLLTFTAGYGIVFAAPGQVPVADALTSLLGQGPPGAPERIAQPREQTRLLSLRLGFGARVAEQLRPRSRHRPGG